MNKLLTIIASIFLFTVSITSLYAKGITFSGTAPTVTGTTNDAAINNALETMFNKMLYDAQNSFSNVGNMPIFLRYMAAANTQVSNAATQINYLNYNLFAITLGTSFAEIGSGDKREAYRDITTKGDMRIGEASQSWALQAGFNAKFLLDGLYLAAKLGKTKNHQTYGILVNYDFFKERLLDEFAIWKGLKLGSGLIYQQNKINIPLDANIQYLPTTEYGYTLRMLLQPDLLMKINSNAIIIPIEAITTMGIISSFHNYEMGNGCNTLSLLLTTGVGVDINYGSTKINMENKSRYIFELAGTPEAVIENPGKVKVHTDINKQRPYYLHPKIMLGLSIGLAGIISDFSYSFYPIGSGFSTNISVGMTY